MMRSILILTFVVNVVLSAVSLFVLPDKVAIHFGSQGMPDSWASTYMNALIMLGANSLIFLLFLFAPSWIRRAPQRWINLPNKSFWMAKENQSAMEAKLKPRMWQLGSITMLFMFCLGLFTMQANLSNPVQLRTDLLLSVLVLYFLYVVYWSYLIYRDFRIPENSLHSNT